jgi:hypothetical protein
MSTQAGAATARPLSATHRDMSVAPVVMLGYSVRRWVLNAGLDVDALSRDLSLSPVLLRQVLIGRHLLQWEVYEQILERCDVQLKCARELREIWQRAKSRAVAGQGFTSSQARASTGLMPPSAEPEQSRSAKPSKCEFAALLRRLRAESGMTMKQAIAASGLARSSVYAMVHKMNPTLPTKQDVIIKFLRAMNVPQEQIDQAVRMWADLVARADPPATTTSLSDELAASQVVPDEPVQHPDPRHEAATLVAHQALLRSMADDAPAQRDEKVRLLLLFLVFWLAYLGMRVLAVTHPATVVTGDVVVGVLGALTMVQVVVCVVALSWSPWRYLRSLCPPHDTADKASPEADPVTTWIPDLKSTGGLQRVQFQVKNAGLPTVRQTDD